MLKIQSHVKAYIQRGILNKIYFLVDRCRNFEIKIIFKRSNVIFYPFANLNFVT